MMAAPVDLMKARKLVDRAAERGISYVNGQAYAWFRAVLEPAVEMLCRSKEQPDDLRLAGDGLYLIGDVYDVSINAPLMAARSYRRAVRLCPGFSYAWRELGSMLSDAGRHKAAVAALKRAVRLDPEDKDAELDLEWALKEAHENRPSWRETADPLWRVSELLAAKRHDEAMDQVRAVRGVAGILGRARVYGALGQADEVLRQWRRLEGKKVRQIDLAYPDWYFLPDELTDRAEFWRVVKRLVPKLGPHVFPSFFELMWNSGRRFKGKSTYSYRTWYRAMCDYNLARCTKRARYLNGALRKYPEWARGQRLHDRLTQAKGNR
jgi:tetratricopeptide (TPR) repeat protein